MSASRAGPSFSEASLRRISGFHSGIFSLCDPVDRVDKYLPASQLGGQNFSTLRSHAVIASSALAALFNPAALNPTALFHAIKQWVERGHIEVHRASRPLL